MQWAGAATPISGATNAAYTTSTPGIYFATYAANSCGGASDYSIVVDDCGIDATVNLFSGVSTGMFQWFKNNAAIPSEVNSSLAVVSDQSPSTYYAEIAPTTGCSTTSASFTIINLNACEDTDQDGIADEDDLDDDNDGIPDLIEVPSDPLADADDDGVPAWLDDDDSLATIGNTDGLPEAGFDTDGDGVPNHLDLDSDNDGITDILEGGGIDTDNDGAVDYPTPGDPTSMTDADMDGLSDDPIADTNNDGIADTPADTDTSGPVAGTNLPIPNTDGTGEPDFLDLDSDDDGIPDNIEAFAAGGYIPPSGNDADMDGLDDAYDNDDNTSTGLDDGPGSPVNPTDTDSDGAPDFQDLDSDNDSINDIVEAGGTDADMNGLIDNPADEGTLTTPLNSDGDNIPDFQDVDSDNDGTNDIDGTPDAGLDTDNDGMIDNTTDTDEDGIPDDIDGLVGHGDAPDSDGDGIADEDDLDDDNDGIPDLIEVPSDPLADVDDDGVPAWLDDDDSLATIGNTDGLPEAGFDTDGDGIPNHLDLDSDNDGITDIVEGGGIDTDNDGVVDYPTPGVPSSMTDADMDGLSDDPVADTNNDGIADAPADTDTSGPTAGTNLPIPNTDNAGNPDFLDIDSDDDGIPDNIEAFAAGGYIPPSGNDADMDGLDDAYDNDDNTSAGLDDGPGSPVNPTDTDSDGAPDFQDLDSDNDSINDIVEAGGTDADMDGLIDNPADEGTLTTPLNSDGDNIPDFQDVDSDNDGTNDIDGTPDVALDTDGDGMVDNTTDTDGDGIPDVIDGLVGHGDSPDTDGDGVSNAIDLDDDDDGIPDLIEIATSTNNGDTDGDGVPDHQDLDSDNDGINDIDESGGTDNDGNGMVDTPAAEGATTMPTDTDGDGIPDFQEVDSNNDGVTDIAGTPDAGLDMDGDGQIDNTMDSDEDGILDPVDGLPTIFGDEPLGVALRLKILLQGPYLSATGLMNDNLVRSGIIPTREPYTGLGYTHITGGGELVSAAVLATTGSTSVVDWVFVELRAPTTLTTILETRAGLLLANGNIVDVDGVSPLRFTSPANTFYVVVRHRNHLAVMTPGALSLSGTPTFHDFTGGSAFGNINGDAQKSLGGGLFALYEADFNGDEAINAADRSIAWNSRNLTGYRIDDSSFNGVCDAAERSQCWNNRNLVSKVP